jgi:hypothetical protein
MLSRYFGVEVLGPSSLDALWDASGWKVFLPLHDVDGPDGFSS